MMQNMPAIDAVADLSRLRTVLYQSGTLVHGPYGMGMQPVDADLTAIAELSGTGLATRTGSGTWATRTITGTASRITVTNGNGVSGNPTIDISTSYAGQATITTLGTVATGTWAAGAVTAAIAGATPIVAHRTNNTVNVTFEARPQSGNSMFFGLGAADTFAVRGGIADLNASSWMAVTSTSATFAGSVVASTFSGNGAAITNLTAANLTGTIDDARLPTSQSAKSFTTVSVGTFSTVGATSGKSISTNTYSSSRDSTANATHIAIYNPNGQVGGVTSNASATSFNTSSDERLKENFEPLDGGVLIDAINAYSFDWKNGGHGVGVKAQECFTVFPDAVTPGEGEAPWAVDYSKFVPLLLAEVKALRARVTELEAS